MEQSISFKEIILMLKKRIGLIALFTLAGIIISSVLTFFVIKPKYTSESQLIVTLSTNQENPNMNMNDVNANLMMLNTYKDLIKGNAVLSEVQKRAQEEANFKGTIGDLDKMISVKQSQNSQMFSIIVTTDNAYTSESVVNITAEVFQTKVKEILTVNKISVISKGKVNLSPTSPNKKLNIAIGLVVGMMIGFGIAFLIEFLDKTVKEENFITEDLGLKLLGTLVNMPVKEHDLSIRKTQMLMKINQSGPDVVRRRRTDNQEISIVTKRSRSRL